MYKIFHEEHGLLETDRVFIRCKEHATMPEHIFKAMYKYPWEVIALIKEYRPTNKVSTVHYDYTEVILQSFKTEHEAKAFLRDGAAKYLNGDNDREPIWWIYEEED